jgi:hypothetical protein
MNLQYIFDNKGIPTGVFIPVKDWEKIKKKYEGIENEISAIDVIPQWHKEIIDQRLNEYKTYPVNAMEIDKVCDDIENEV